MVTSSAKLDVSPARRLVVEPAAAGERLDRYLAARLPELSRAQVQRLIEQGAVQVAGRAVRPATRVAAGQEITLAIPPPVPATPQPEAIPLDVLYEDGDLLVVNKPAGMVVHPAPGHAGGTLVNALLARCPDLAGIGGKLRPGIVHRLDKETSGLLVVAKHERAHRWLAAQLKARQMEKRYLALVDGAPATATGTIDAPIGRDPRHSQRMAVVAGGREALTHFRLLRRYRHHALLEVRPITGRTHQIRVHLASIGCPVAGDRVYGRRQPTLPLTRHFLHAARLTFQLLSGQTRTFEAPLPPDLQLVLELLEQQEV
jgi:23S rRNA pseudouridine1911/1915/1917 synthase